MIFNYFPCERPAAPLPLGHYIADCNLSPKICKIVSPRNLQPFSFNLSCIFQTKKNCGQYYKCSVVSQLFSDMTHLRRHPSFDDLPTLVCALVFFSSTDSGMYLSRFQMCLSQMENVFVPIVKCICPNCQMYLSRFQMCLSQFVKCICPNCSMRIFPLSNVCPCVLELYRQRKGSSRKLLMLGSKVHGQVAR